MKNHIWQSPFGPICLSLKKEKLFRLSFISAGQTIPDTQDDCRFSPYIAWLQAYFKKEKPSINDLELQLDGTEFQLKVWQALLQIPYGATLSYSELWSGICGHASHSHARATGNAVAKNPVWIILPCHRILHADGSIGGYAGGAHLKKKLLEHEGVTLCKI